MVVGNLLGSARQHLIQLYDVGASCAKFVSRAIAANHDLLRHGYTPTEGYTPRRKLPTARRALTGLRFRSDDDHLVGQSDLLSVELLRMVQIKGQTLKVHARNTHHAKRGPRLSAADHLLGVLFYEHHSSGARHYLRAL